MHVDIPTESRAATARFLARTEVGPGLWVALFRDPNGALMALASSTGRE